MGIVLQQNQKRPTRQQCYALISLTARRKDHAEPKTDNCEEYKARRQAIVIDVLYGMTYAEAAREYRMTDATVRQAVKNELLKLRRYHGHPRGLWWTGYHVPAKDIYQRGVKLVLLFDAMWKEQAK